VKVQGDEEAKEGKGKRKGIAAPVGDSSETYKTKRYLNLSRVGKADDIVCSRLFGRWQLPGVVRGA
jgi:hypothetical protein